MRNARPKNNHCMIETMPRAWPHSSPARSDLLRHLGHRCEGTRPTRVLAAVPMTHRNCSLHTCRVCAFTLTRIAGCGEPTLCNAPRETNIPVTKRALAQPLLCRVLLQHACVIINQRRCARLATCASHRDEQQIACCVHCVNVRHAKQLA